MKKFTKFIGFAVLLNVTCCAPMVAGEIATPEGTLQGVVMDKKGRPLSAIIKVKGPDGRKRAVESQSSGRFVLSQLPPGPYTIVVISTFYDVTRIKKVEVTGDQITELVITLKEVENCCLIRGAIPNPVDTTSSTSITHMNF
jgi:hypothetical protein